jgi:hypothetical protein
VIIMSLCFGSYELLIRVSDQDNLFSIHSLAYLEMSVLSVASVNTQFEACILP